MVERGAIAAQTIVQREALVPRKVERAPEIHRRGAAGGVTAIGNQPGRVGVRALHHDIIENIAGRCIVSDDDVLCVAVVVYI